MNAHCERTIGTIRRETLDHVLILNEAHAGRVLAAYQRHYKEHRPHQARNQLPPGAREQPATVQGPRQPQNTAQPNPRRPDQRVPLRHLTSGDDFSSGTR